ncbi:GNAT family N-acetyltransferase [uncultured Tateyamaria sp.]|uniref:GNAT family N-acetyltransferase n=1 Tax=uncultured Tateyamaria sp. TaxID=455651 RepID=UPI002611F201|nr:GNAT family N-acetyltransferase [uncultured Tateyamaria sp.]
MIKPATSDDAQWIADLWNTIITDTLATFTTTPKTRVEMAAMITKGPVLVLPDAQGFATFGPFRPGPGYAHTVEHSIFLAPDARGKGQGRALMQALIDTARTQGVHVMVAAISGANPRAADFHARSGFEQVACMPQVGRKAGQWLDLILMQKMLGRSTDATTSPANTV